MGGEKRGRAVTIRKGEGEGDELKRKVRKRVFVARKVGISTTLTT